MRPNSWKKLQRSAYAFYALMYIHVLLLNTHNARNGVWTAVLNVTLYSCLFLCYFVMRISRCLQDHRKEHWIPAAQIAGFAVLAAVLVLIFMPVKQDTIDEVGQAVSSEVKAEEPVRYTDGVYKGAAIGYNGRLKVKVTVEDGRISDLQVASHVEDEPYITNASEGVFAQILETGTTWVDSVSAATTTSDALMEAVRNALNDAAEE